MKKNKPIQVTTLFLDIGGVVDRLPHLGTKGAYLKQMMQDKLIEHNLYIDKHGKDLPEIHN